MRRCLFPSKEVYFRFSLSTLELTLREVSPSLNSSLHNVIEKVNYYYYCY